MKKLCLIVFSFVFCASFIDASEYIEPTVKESGFNIGDTFKESVSDTFDYSLITFSTNKDNVSIRGKSNMRKIYSVSDTSKFTAYCLDGNKKYPEYNVSFYNSNITSSNLIKYMAIFEVFKEAKSNSCTLFDNIEKVQGFTLTGIDDASSDTITNFDNNESITVSISKIGLVYDQSTNNYTEFTASNLASCLGKELNNDNKIEVSFKKSDFEYNTYNVGNMPTNENYNKALWIIEHSYPSLTLADFLNYADVNYDTLKSTLLESYETIDSTAAQWTDTKKDELVKDYVYATIQYAIWKVIGEYYECSSANVCEDSEKIHLGDTLTGNTELNKIYQYLINEQEYVSTYSSTLSVINPSSESYRSTSDAEYYGPYKVKSNMMYTGNIYATLISPTTGVTLVNSNLVEITKNDSKYDLGTVDENGYVEFYVRIDNSAKTTTKVKINLTADGKIYNSDINRGKLLISNSSLDQVLAVSAKIVDTSALNELTLEYNAKTGDINAGIIFIVITISFGLGYMALKMKEKPIDNL